MDSQTELDEIVKSITEINARSNYWFIRTQSGSYFDEFLKSKFVAIGYNEVTLNDIKEAIKNGEQAHSVLKERVKKVYKKEEKKPKFAASQLLKFVQQIKLGDIIIIPSASSESFSFGTITSEVFNGKISADGKGCPYIKRRSVNWIKTVSRYSIDPKLYGLMFAHQAINNVSSYSEYVDRALYSLYVKNNKTHLILSVTASGAIQFEDMFGFGGVVPLTKEFIAQQNLTIDTTNIESKVGVQSDGIIEMIVQHPSLAVLIGMLVGVVGVLTVGGTTEFTYKGKDKDQAKLAVKSDGLIDKLAAFLSQKKRDDAMTKLVDKSVKTMNVKSPKEIEKLIDILRKKK